MNGKKLLWYDDIKKTIAMMNIILGIIVVISLSLKFKEVETTSFSWNSLYKEEV